MALLLATLLLSGATVTLPMEANCQGTEVELGEIATIQTDDPALALELANLELGYAPAPGYSRLLDVDAIERAIQRALPGVQVNFAGKPACRVRPEVVQLQPDELHDAARAALDQLLIGRDATVELRDPVRGVSIPAGSTNHVLRPRLENREVISGTVSIPVQVLVDGVVYRTVWTAWQVDLFETMFVVAQPVPAGTLLSPAHFQRRRVRVGTGMQGRALPMSQLVGAAAARDLREGETVSSLDVQRPTVIQAGATVFLEVRKGAVRARVAAQAMQAGAVGDRIRVQNVSSGQELIAVVQSRDFVAIELSH